MVTSRDVEHMALLAGLPQRERARVAGLLNERHLAREEYVFFEGDDAEWLCFVRSGQVKLLKHSEAGKDVVLEVVSPGQVFGEVAAVDGQPYPITAQALEPTVLFCLRRADYLDLLRRHPDLALRAISEAGRRLRTAYDMMRSLAVEHVERRIARVLLRLVGTTGIRNERGIVIGLPLSRRDLANMAGTTMETAIRVMSKLAKEGIVDTEHRGQVVVLEPHELVRVAEELDEPPARQT